MNVKELENVEQWAVKTFGAAELGDPRRTDRLVKVAAALGENPSVSLPASMRNWADTQGAYRFLKNEAVNHEQIMMPHWAQTRWEAEQRSQVLMIGDATEVNLSTHKRFVLVAERGRELYSTLTLCASCRWTKESESQTSQVQGRSTQELVNHHAHAMSSQLGSNSGQDSPMAFGIMLGQVQLFLQLSVDGFADET